MVRALPHLHVEAAHEDGIGGVQLAVDEHLALGAGVGRERVEVQLKALRGRGEGHEGRDDLVGGLEHRRVGHDLAARGPGQDPRAHERHLIGGERGAAERHRVAVPIGGAVVVGGAAFEAHLQLVEQEAVLRIVGADEVEAFFAGHAVLWAHVHERVEGLHVVEGEAARAAHRVVAAARGAGGREQLRAHRQKRAPVDARHIRGRVAGGEAEGQGEGQKPEGAAHRIKLGRCRTYVTKTSRTSHRTAPEGSVSPAA